MSASAALLAMRFVIIGGVNEDGFGTLGAQAATAGKPPGISDRDRADARRLGERFARLTRQLRASPEGMIHPPSNGRPSTYPRRAGHHCGTTVMRRRMTGYTSSRIGIWQSNRPPITRLISASVGDWLRWRL